MSDNSDSDFSDASAPNEEDLKMQKLLAEWDEKDAQNDDVYEDDEDDDYAEDEARKKALLAAGEGEDDEEEEFEEEEVVEEEEQELPTKSSSSKKSAPVVRDDDDDDDDEEEDDDDIVLPLKAAPAPPKSVSRGRVDDDDDEVTVDATVADNGPITDTLKKKPKPKKAKKPSKKITEIEEDDNEEDKEMKNLLANWDAENGDDKEEEDEKEEEDDDSEVSEREVQLEDNVIDHIVLAAPDLEDAMSEFEKKTGIGAVIAGTIKGLGIKCARISFNDSSYLEIIAPDPKGPGPIGELIKSKGIKELTPFHWAIRTSRAEEMKDEVTKLGYTPDHITMFGAKADGTPRKWEMLYLYGHKLGGVCPFFINWANSDHPCATLPVVGKLKKFTIRAPEDDPVHSMLESMPLQGVNVETGKPKISFQFSSPEGTIKFASHKAVGFKFPGFEADVGVIPGDDGDQDADVVFEDPKVPDLLPVSDVDYDDIPPPAY